MANKNAKVFYSIGAGMDMRKIEVLFFILFVLGLESLSLSILSSFLSLVTCLVSHYFYVEYVWQSLCCVLLEQNFPSKLFVNSKCFVVFLSWVFFVVVVVVVCPYISILANQNYFLSFVGFVNCQSWTATVSICL